MAEEAVNPAVESWDKQNGREDFGDMAAVFVMEGEWKRVGKTAQRLDDPVDPVETADVWGTSHSVMTGVRMVRYSQIPPKDYAEDTELLISDWYRVAD